MIPAIGSSFATNSTIAPSNTPSVSSGVAPSTGASSVDFNEFTEVLSRVMVDAVIDEVTIAEDREEFIRLQLGMGQSLDGLYPMGPKWEERFRAWRRETEGSPLSDPG